ARGCSGAGLGVLGLHPRERGRASASTLCLSLGSTLFFDPAVAREPTGHWRQGLFPKGQALYDILFLRKTCLKVLLHLQFSLDYVSVTCGVIDVLSLEVIGLAFFELLSDKRACVPLGT
ncbi:unnamed protein product, partial [Discosporangium mesarthrocarpum]